MTGRIVVGVDGSGSSRQALRWAVDAARLRGAEVDAVFVWHHPEATFVPMYGLPAQSELDQAAVGELKRILRDEGLSPNGDVPVNPVVVQGSPASTLIEASSGADLLVVGSRGRGAFHGMLLGSVSQHCVSHAACPVVVVRPSDDE